MATKPKTAKPSAIMQDPNKIIALNTATKTGVGSAKSSARPKAASVQPATPLRETPAQLVAASPSKGANSANAALKKKDLIDKVMSTTGAKKNVVRDIVEATLTVLGDALSKGTMLNLPPFGKAKVSRPSDALSGKAMTVKLRRGQGAGKSAAKDRPFLADEED